MASPRIVTIDIENSLIDLTSFSLWPKNGLPPEGIIQDWSITSVAWKYLDKKEVEGLCVKKVGDDRALLKAISKVLNEADLVVGHNIAAFDLTKIRTRLAYWGLPSLKKLNIFDTYKVTKRDFNFTSNRLDYLAQYLKVGKKLDTPKGLWMDVLRGSAKALQETLKYNKHDVIINEGVYLKLRGHASSTPNLSIYVDDIYKSDCRCPDCHSLNLKKQGYKKLKSGLYRRYQCLDCGGWARGLLNLETPETAKRKTKSYLIKS